MVRVASKRSVDTLRDVSSVALRLASLAESVLREGRLHQEEGVALVVRAMLDEAKRTVSIAQADPLGLTFIRDVLRPQVFEATRREYEVERPWPQPHPMHPEGLATTVLNVPAAEVQEFLETVVARYVRTLKAHVPRAAVEAWRQRSLDEVGDREFGRFFKDRVFCRFANDRLDARDERTFARFLREPQGADSRFFKADFTALETAATFPGIHLAPTVTLFEQPGAGAAFRPRAIHVNGKVFAPEDGSSWELAKHFVLQGAGLSLIVGIHPTVHFPVDAVNAMTKSLLRADHPVRRALEPHCYLQLPLNFAVLHIDRSLANNDQRELYAALPFEKRDFFNIARRYHEGDAGNSSYPAYRYPLTAPSVPFKYGEFLSAYYDAVLAFTRSVAEAVQPGDVEILRWARHLSAVVPGFPGEAEIFQGETLARAMATFIHDVSVVHAADHHDYANIPVTTVPLRLRQPPPDGTASGPLDRSRLIQWEDIFRHMMCHEMYFKPTNVRRLVEVRYDFREPLLRARSREFLASLVQVDRKVGRYGFIPLEEISCSIQY